jgi:hypothetical protein
VVNGTVTISIKDFTELTKKSEEAEMRIIGTRRASKELEVFLSFLCISKNMDSSIEEFNRQSTTSEIIMTEGRAKIKFKDQL